VKPSGIITAGYMDELKTRREIRNHKAGEDAGEQTVCEMRHCEFVTM